MSKLDYSPLWATMKEKGVDTLKKGGNITLLTLEKICSILDCTPNDVVQFTK